MKNKNLFRVTFGTTLLLLFFTSFSYAQLTSPYMIQGKVFENQTNNPIVGVNVIIKGQSTGVITDIDGEFTIALTDSCTTLDFTVVGYQSFQLSNVCSDGQKVKVYLSPDPLSIEEEVIEDIAYEKADRRERKKISLFRSNKAMTMSEAAPANYNSRGKGQMHGITRPPVRPRPSLGDVVINHNTEDYDRIEENRFFAVQNEPLSTFSIDVDAAAYSNMRRFINNGSLPPKDAVRIEEMVNYFKYDYPAPKEEHPFSVSTELSKAPWNPKHQLLHIGLQGKKIPTENLPASNLVFLIDVSGSMSAANKLPLLKSSFKLLTDQLRPQDHVSIVVYASASGTVLKPTPGNQKDKIIAALDKLEAGGSTAGGAGIKLAYKLARQNFVEGGNNRVIIATDGDFNVGPSSDAALERMIEEERKSGVFLTVLGFGMGNYKDNKMQKLANKGNGNHAYIDNIDEARKVLVTEFGGTMFTIAKDVKLQLEFNPAYVAAYRLIGYENRILNNEDFNDDKKDAGELGSGHTVTALYEIIPAGTQSDFLKKVDDLKYQDNKVAKGAKNNELMTVKLRYKQPDGDTSQLLSHIQKAKGTDLKKSSDNFRWSAAVAELGLLLRQSEYKQAASYAQVLELAKGARGDDEDGYRSEFIRMVKSVRDLSEPITAEKN